MTIHRSKVKSRRVRVQQSRKVAQITALETQLAEKNKTIAEQDALIAQMVQDALKDAYQIDDLAKQVRSANEQYGMRLPREIDSDLLIQSYPDGDDIQKFNEVFNQRIAAGWQVLKIDHLENFRATTFWKPKAAITPLVRYEVAVVSVPKISDLVKIGGR